MADATFPSGSAAVQVTTVSPSGNTRGASFVIVTSWISVAFGTPKDTRFSDAEVASKNTLLRAEIDGAVVSTMVTNCVVVATLPDTSAAIHVTVVLPRLKNCGASLVTDSIRPFSITVASPRYTSFRLRLDASKMMS